MRGSGNPPDVHSKRSWYCGETLWTATFSEQRVCENFEERLSDSGPDCVCACAHN